jgi:ATP-dependent protease Clp ATPase subunit
MKQQQQQPTRHCSFCKKSEHEVEVLIAAPPTYICDECVSASVEIIKTRLERKLYEWRRKDGVLARARELLSFVPSPKEEGGVG